MKHQKTQQQSDELIKYPRLSRRMADSQQSPPFLNTKMSEKKNKDQKVVREIVEKRVDRI